jgi:hypothetical protein
MFASAKRRIRFRSKLGIEASQGLWHQSLHRQCIRAINCRDTERSHAPAWEGHARVELGSGYHDDLGIKVESKKANGLTG